MKIKCPYCKIYNKFYFRKEIDYEGDRIEYCKHCKEPFYIPTMGSVGKKVPII